MEAAQPAGAGTRSDGCAVGVCSREECAMRALPITLPRETVAEFCRRHHIRRLALFGSVLRDDFRPDSDVDVLVEFEPDHIPTLPGMAGMERELAGMLEGRRVDLRTAEELSRYFRDEVVATAEVIYPES